MARRSRRRPTLLDAAGFPRSTRPAPGRTLPARASWPRRRARRLAASRRVAPAPFRIVGAHTDSPDLRVKPHPDRRARRVAAARRRGLRRRAAEHLARPRPRHRRTGRARRRDDALVDVADPVARVPQLAIHLDRDVNEKGLVLDRQRTSRPVWATRARRAAFAQWLAERAGVDGAVVLGAVPVRRQPARRARRRPLADRQRPARQPGVVLGGDDRARSRAEPADHVAMIALFDHEEVGSASTTGRRRAAPRDRDRPLARASAATVDDLHRALAASSCISADNAHAVHPNYPERHEPATARRQPRPGDQDQHQPALRDARGDRGAVPAGCDEAGVPVQAFVSRNNMPCGSTIGPITATRLGIATVDVGVPQLSMHSARELCGADDPPTSPPPSPPHGRDARPAESASSSVERSTGVTPGLAAASSNSALQLVVQLGASSCRRDRARARCPAPGPAARPAGSARRRSRAPCAGG